MTDQTPLLSALLGDDTDRRSFLKKTAISLPALGALASCRRTEGDVAESETAPGVMNANSRADSVAHPGPSGSSATAPTAVDPASVSYTRYDPALPPLSAERTLNIDWSATEIPLRVSNDLVVAAWTFEGNIPGPTLHVREGDTINFTFRNLGTVGHSMDFHAAEIDPKVAFRSIGANDSLSFSFRARYPGAFMYHCGTAPVLMHIASGMFGAIIVDPATPLPEAKEFVLVQSEYYLSEPSGGISAFDYRKMLTLLPDHVAFNGRPSQYIAEPIVVQRGDLVRFYVVNAGPTHPCAFHVVGEQFDRVYLGAPPEAPIRGVQTFNVPAGGGMVFEFEADLPGEYPFVNHGFGHGQKGAVGFLVVE